jgi:hypothetical protein
MALASAWDASGPMHAAMRANVTSKELTMQMHIERSTSRKDFVKSE